MITSIVFIERLIFQNSAVQPLGTTHCLWFSRTFAVHFNSIIANRIINNPFSKGYRRGHTHTAHWFANFLLLPAQRLQRKKADCLCSTDVLQMVVGIITQLAHLLHCMCLCSFGRGKHYWWPGSN